MGGVLCTSLAQWYVTVITFEKQGFLVFASRGVVLDSGIMTYICTVKSRYQDHLG